MRRTPVEDTAMATTERPESEPLYTYDARPVVQEASNRPADDEYLVRAAAGAVTRWRQLQDDEVVPDARRELVAQIAVVFGYAMLGAALFQAGVVVVSLL